MLGLAALGLALLLAPKASSAMTVSPPTLDFTLNPGDVVADVVQVYNEEGIPFKITPRAINFYVKDGDETTGSPDFYDATEVRNGYELAPWLLFDSEPVVIMPNERINIAFQIRVPEDAAPGSHFGGIQIIASKPDEIAPLDGPSLAIDRGTTVLMFVRVTGDTIDELSVPSFGAHKDVLSHLPADFSIRVVNSGTTHQRPVGNVIIDDMWGRRVASLQVNPGPQYASILPGSARRFDVSWSHRRLPVGTSEYQQQLRNFAFGQYTATLLLNYGSASEQKNLTAVTTFWVVPWMALMTYALALLAVILILWYLGRSYNRMLIARYETKKNLKKS